MGLNIALINFGGLGDEILFSPVIAALKAALPDARLSLILEHRSRAIGELMPEVDTVIPVSVPVQNRLGVFRHLLGLLRKGQYDVVLSSGSSPFIAVLLWLSGIPTRIGFDSGPVSRALLTAPAPLNRQAYAGDMYFSLARAALAKLAPLASLPTHAVPQLTISPQTVEAVRPLLASSETASGGKRILIHPGVSRLSVEKGFYKSWPLGSWQAFLEAVLKQYPQDTVYLLGGPDDEAILKDLSAFCQTLPPENQARIVNLYGKTKSLLELVAVMSLGDVLVSVDSAPLHLALGLETPVVALFAPTDEKKLVPNVPWVQVATVPDLPCRPCLWDKRAKSCENPVCTEIPVATVLQCLENLRH